MKIFILAAGEQTRWGDLWEPKQLVDIGGEPLIERIIRQVQEYSSIEPAIVTHDQRFGSAHQRIEPENRDLLCSTLMSTAPYWQEGRTIVLLGDTIFSPEALHTILDCTDQIRVFGRKQLQGRAVGRYYELFALSFDSAVSAKVKDVLKAVIQLDDSSLTKGRLRRFYELYCGLPIGEYQHEDKVFYPIEDWTEDIDTREDYVQFVAMIINRGLLDAKPIT